MKKLVALIAALTLWGGVALAGGPTTGSWGPVNWARSNPGVTNYINQQAVKSIQVKSWTQRSGKTAWGAIVAPNARSSYSATFTGTSGKAGGSTTITRYKGGYSVRSSSFAYSTTK